MNEGSILNPPIFSNIKVELENSEYTVSVLEQLGCSYAWTATNSTIISKTGSSLVLSVVPGKTAVVTCETTSDAGSVAAVTSFMGALPPAWSLSVTLGSGGGTLFTTDSDYETTNYVIPISLAIVNDPGTGTSYAWSLSTTNWAWVDSNTILTTVPTSSQFNAFIEKQESGAEILTVSATIGGVTHTINITISSIGS